jgi:membrane protease YdiL (CAAX protease family)
MKDFFKFSFYPSQEIKKTKSIFLDFLIVLGLYFVGILVVVLLFIFFNQITNNDIQVSNENTRYLSKHYSKSVYFAIVVIIGPLFEELIFRLSLNGKATYLKISFSLGLLLYGSNFLRSENYLTLSNLLLVFVVLVVFLIPNQKFSFIETFAKKNIRLLLHFSALLFAFAHYNKMGLSLSQFYIFPIALFGYYWGGLVFGYYRLKNGLVFSFLCHATINLCSFLLESMF